MVGSIAQLIFTPILPGTDGAPLGTLYKATFGILIATIVLGIGWEFVYHALMQFRWEKDWPTMFGLLDGYQRRRAGLGIRQGDLIPGVPKELPFSTFVTDFLIVWILTFLFVNGPMRVPFVFWRHRGGRLI